MQEVDAQFASRDDPQNVFIFLSAAGMGKSVVSGGLARRGSRTLAGMMGGGQVDPQATEIGALHFFLYSDPFARSIESCVRSLARQLCGSVPGFRAALPGKKDELEKLIKDAVSLGPASLIEQIIINPALAIKSPPMHKIAVLLDALDECESPDQLSQAIAKVWLKAPSWLALIATARPTDPIAMPLDGFHPHTLQPDNYMNERDLRMFLKSRIVDAWGVKVEGGVADQVIEAAFTQSEGVFLWLAFQEEAMKALAEKKELTVDNIAALPKGVEQTYAQYFERLKKAMGDDKAAYRRAVSLAVVVPRVPIPETIWCHALGFKNVEQLDYLETVRAPASQLLLFGGNGEVRPPHKSMIDWLTGVGDKCAKKTGFVALAVEAEEDHHKAVAAVCEAEYAGVKENAMWGQWG